MSTIKLSQIANGGSANFQTDQVVTVRNGNTDVLTNISVYGIDAKSAFGLAGDGVTDDTYDLNVGLASLTYGGKVIMYTPNDGFYFNAGIVIPSNIILEWQSDRVYGPNAWTKVIGYYSVTDPETGNNVAISQEISNAANTISTVTANGSASSTTLTVSNGGAFSNNDMVLVLGERDAAGSTIPRTSFYSIINSKSGNNLTLQDALPVSFSTTYTNPSYEANFGIQNKTYVYKIRGALLTANANYGSYVVNIANTTGITVGSLYHLMDNLETPSGNDANQETVRIAEVVSATQLRLQRPVLGDYLTSRSARMMLFNPVSDSRQVGNPGITRLAANQTSVNYHLNFYDLYQRCGDTDLVMDNSGSFKSLANFFRVRPGLWYESRSAKFTPTDNLAGGEGYFYGIYGATMFNVHDGQCEGARHGYLAFQSARGGAFYDCVAYDTLTAAFDCHGGGESDNMFINCRYYGRSNRDTTGNDVGFKFGNPTHQLGPYRTKFAGCHVLLEYTGNAADDDPTIKSIGFEYVPGNANCAMIDCTVTNTNIGVRAIQNSDNNASYTDDIQISGFRTYAVRQESILIDGSNTLNVRGISIDGVSMFNSGTLVSNTSAQVYVAQYNNGATIQGVRNYNQGNIANNTAYCIRVTNGDSAIVRDFTINGGQRGIRVDGTTTAHVGPGTMRSLDDGTVFFQTGNTTVTWENVDILGVTNASFSGNAPTTMTAAWPNGRARIATGNATANATDIGGIIYMNGTNTAQRTCNLPNASLLIPGATFGIKNRPDASCNVVVQVVNNSILIDNNASVTLTVGQIGFFQVKSDGSGYMVV